MGIAAVKTMAVVALALAVAGCGGKEKRMAEHLEKGRSFFAQGIYDKAQVELKNVLQIDPKAGEPYFLFGQIEERQKNLQKAFGYYLKAVELAPENLKARAKLGALYVLGNKLEEASAQANAILAAKADDADGLVLRAAVLGRRGDLAGAAQRAAEVVGRYPDHVEARSLYAALLAGQGQRERARAVLQQGVAATPQSVELRLALISLLLMDRQADEAAKQYAGLIALDGKAIEHRIGLARVQAEQGQLDQAEATLRAAIAADPADDQRYVFLADFLASRRDAAAAEKALNEFIAQRPQAHTLRFALAQLYRTRGPADKAEGVYREIIAKDASGPDGIRARGELADVLLVRGKSGEAGTLVAEVLKANPRDNRALVLRGKMSLARGDAVNAIADFRTVLKDQPDAVELVANLARAHLANDEKALAQDTLAQALGRYPNALPLRVMLAELKTASGDYPGAGADLDAVLAQAPGDVSAMMARANLEARRGDATAAERTLVSLRDSSPQDAVGYHRLAAFYLTRKQYKEAEAQFERALELAPGAIEPLTGLLNIAIARGQPKAGVARIEKARESSPDNFLLWALLGHAHAAAKDAKAAEQAFRMAVAKGPSVAGSYVELGKFLSASGNDAGAVRVLEEGLKTLPDNAVLAAQLAQTHTRSQRYDDAIAIYDRMLTVDAGNDLAANNLAMLLLEYRTQRVDHERALQLANRFDASLNPAYLDTLGWAHYRLGTGDKAVEVLRRASARAPASVMLSFHLGMALHAKGDVAQALPHLQKAVDSKLAIPGIEEAKKILSAG